MTPDKPSPAKTHPSRGEPGPRERIMEAAVRLFAKKSFAATGVRELAKEAGVNLAAINYTFGSKINVLKEIMNGFFADYIRIVEANLRGVEPVEEEVRRTIEAAAVYVRENKEKVIIGLTHLPHDDPEVTELKAGWVRRIVPIFQERVADRLERAYGGKVPLALVGPAAIVLIFSHFLFRPVIEKAMPPGFDDDFLEEYPSLVAQLYLHGLLGLAGRKDEENV